MTNERRAAAHLAGEYGSRLQCRQKAADDWVVYEKP